MQQDRVRAGVLAAYRWQYIVSGVKEPRFSDILGSMITQSQAAASEALAPIVEWTHCWDRTEDAPMPILDARGCPITGASPRALEHFESALAGVPALSRRSTRTAARRDRGIPGVRDGADVRGLPASRRPNPAGADIGANILGDINAGGLNSRERGYFAALAAAVAGDNEAASGLLGSLLHEYPRDALALQVAHSFHYVRGDAHSLRSRVETVLPAWSAEIPGYHAVLSMLAFGLEECGEGNGRAEETALHALQLEPRDVRAHHAVAHILEMQGRALEGVYWMKLRASHWAGEGPMATHHSWHLALFQLEAEGGQPALETYDRYIGPGTGAILDSIVTFGAPAGGCTCARWNSPAAGARSPSAGRHTWEMCTAPSTTCTR